MDINIHILLNIVFCNFRGYGVSGLAVRVGRSCIKQALWQSLLNAALSGFGVGKS